MMKRILLSLALLTFGVLFAVSGHHHWSTDPVRSYQPAKGIVLDHEVKVNRQRWTDDVPKAMELATRVKFSHDAGRERTTAGCSRILHARRLRLEARLHRACWQPGGLPDCTGTQEGIRDSWEPSGPMLAMVVGGVLMLIAVGCICPSGPFAGADTPW
jgi:hypothetical protein